MDTNGTQKPMDLETLAIMVAEGFRDVMERLDQKADKSDVDGLKLEVHEIKQEISEIKTDIYKIKDGQELIRLRLDQTAPQFEITDLKRRVKILETKNGIMN